MLSVSKLVSLVAAASLVPPALAIELPSFLFKDTVVVGGGASGAHAAVRLREDYKKSIVLIEKQAILGGHVDSYTDPKTGFTMNYGVQNWIDQGNARGFFERLGVPVDAPGRLPTTTRYVDFTDGEAVNFTAPAMPDQLAALAKFRDIVEQWDDIIQPGYFNFPAPKNIPADLLLPFGQFVKKYGLESAVPFIFRTTGFGVGDVVNELTLYVVQAYGASMARSILGEQASIVPKSGRNQDLYDAVGKKLGDDVLYSSTVIDTWRTSFGVLVTVQNSKTKKITIITARRLLMAIEPTAANLKPFNTDKAENDVFSKFEGSRIYAGIVSNEALPVNFSLFNIPEAAAPSNTLVYPEVPFLARFDYFGSDKYFRILVIAGTDLEPEAAKKLVQKNFETLIASGAVKTPANEALQWVALEDHGAMHLRVSAQELKAGFIQKQYALQGRRSTWWTGGAFSVQFQTALWDFNDVLLEKLVAN